MKEASVPITLDTPVCQVISCLPEKFIVDFANGIAVSRDHIRVQRERTGFFQRCLDGFTGASARRQADIHASLTDGVEGALKWLNELTGSLAQTNLALTQVNQRVEKIQRNVAELAHYSADTREQLYQLASHVNQKCLHLQADIHRIDVEQRAARHLDQMFNKWKAGHFKAFSPAVRCYLVFEELWWGDFGEYCRHHQGKVQRDFLDDLKNRAISQLAADLNTTPSARNKMADWIAVPTQAPLKFSEEATAYLGDWASEAWQPFCFALSQQPEQWPVGLPHLANAERLTSALAHERFQDCL